MPKPFLLIDGSTTLHGIKFLMSGGRMDRFRNNPVMLYMHQRGNAIGRWENLRMEADGWLADPVFDTDDADALRISGKVDRGFLKACSMGVAIHAVQEMGDELVATDWEPYECSIVDAGSNAHALHLYSPDGEVVADARAHIKQLTLSIMSEQKKDVTPAAEAPAGVVVPKEIALAAGLAEDATPTSVAEKIKALQEENKNLKLAADANSQQRIKDLLDQAVADKKIAEGDRTHYETLAAGNFDAVKAIIARIPVPVDLAAYAKSGAADPSGEVSQAEEWDKLDKAGKLVELKATDTTKFKALYKARFGVEYKD